MCIKKIFLIAVLIFVLENKIYGEEDKENGDWRFSGILGINYNQTIVSPNWSGSEEDSFNWLIRGEVRANRIREKTSWENFFEAEFGESQSEEGGDVKNTDKFFLQNIPNLLKDF